MADWTFEGDPYRYQGGADPSADVDGGIKFTLRDDGDTATINVEAARGAGGNLTEASARNAIKSYLDDETLPRRIVLGTDGNFYPEYEGG
jgi:hypothetical protein